MEKKDEKDKKKSKYNKKKEDSYKYMNTEQKIRYINYINDKYKYEDNICEMMLSDDILIYYKYDVKNNDKCKKKHINLLKKIINFLEEKEITYWIDDELLLNIKRNNNKIPWSENITLGIPYDSYINILEIINKYPKEIINEIEYRICNKYKIKFKEILSFSPVDSEKPFLIKIFYLNEKYEEISITLVLYFIFNNKYVRNLTNWLDIHNYNINDVYPLKKVEYDGNKYYSVNNSKSYLNNAFWYWRDLVLLGFDNIDNNKFNIDKKIYLVIK